VDTAPAGALTRLSAAAERVPLVAIVGIALLARLAVIAYLGNWQPWFGQQEWDYIARVIVQHGFYGIDVNSDYGSSTLTVTSFIPPLYPFFLAAMNEVFGSQAWLAIRLVQALLSTASVWLICDIAWRLFSRRDIAWLCGLMAALSPPLAGGVAEVDPVSFEVFLVLVYVYLTLPPRLMPAAPRWRWPAAGAVLGLAALVRAPILLLLPWLVVLLWANRPAGAPWLRTVAGPTLAAGLAAAAVISPWTIRNYVVQHAFVPISTNGGINFWIGDNPSAAGEYVWPPGAAPDLLQASANLSEPQRDAFFYQQGLTFVREQPAQAMRLLGLKLLYFLWERPGIGATYGGQPATGLGRTAYLLANAVLLPLWLLGLALTARTWRPMMVIYGPILAALAQNVIYFVATRFRTPAVPFETLLAAVAIVWAAHAAEGVARVLRPAMGRVRLRL